MTLVPIVMGRFPYTAPYHLRQKGLSAIVLLCCWCEAKELVMSFAGAIFCKTEKVKQLFAKPHSASSSNSSQLCHWEIAEITKYY